MKLREAAGRAEANDVEQVSRLCKPYPSLRSRGWALPSPMPVCWEFGHRHSAACRALLLVVLLTPAAAGRNGVSNGLRGRAKQSTCWSIIAIPPLRPLASHLDNRLWVYLAHSLWVFRLILFLDVARRHALLQSMMMMLTFKF